MTLRSQNNIYMEMNIFFPSWIWTTADRRLQISTMRHKVKGLKMVSSLTRSIEWLSCLAAVQFYLLELLGDRNVLGGSVFWEMMRAMNEIPSSVTCYLLSPLLSCRSMERKAAFKKREKRKKVSLRVVGALWKAANKQSRCKVTEVVEMGQVL